jgi:transketolase
VAVELVDSLGQGYLGQAMSAAELLTVGLGLWLRPSTDRFVLSPGHYVTAVYAVSVALGTLDRSRLDTYGQDGSQFETIGTESTPIVDFTCGSLGQGLSVGIGYALASRLNGDGRRTLVLISDGEMEEGQLWEAAMFAGHHRMGDLMVLLDCNDSQVDGPVSSVTTVDPVAGKWAAFGWDAHEVDGHDSASIWKAMSAPPTDRPRVVVGHTTTSGGLSNLADLSGAHFVELTPDLTSALKSEIEGRL